MMKHMKDEFTEGEAIMKHIVYVGLAGMILAGSLAIPMRAQDEPLGDYARKVRQEKTKEQPANKKFDNDNLPTEEKLSVVGNAAPEQGAADTAEKPAEKTEEKAPQSVEQRQKAYDEWKNKIAGQKEQIDTLARELDVLQREYRLRAASFYADAGERLRNAAAWDKEDAQYKQQIADKQKALDDAKQHLDDMQEDARKSGVPPSVRE
jgi:hypothetical protein